MSQHTPGPWSLPHFAEPDVNCECGYVLCDHMMGAVATVHCSGEGGDCQKHGDNPKFAEAVANARLIAAAPEMLEVLKFFACIDFDHFTEHDEALLDDVKRDAAAVIAKAEGEQTAEQIRS